VQWELEAGFEVLAVGGAIIRDGRDLSRQCTISFIFAVAFI